MRFPRLFKDSAYPELDRELRELLLRHTGKKMMVLVHVRLSHLSQPSDVHALYLFSKKTPTIRGIKLKGPLSSVTEIVEFGRIFADYYSRRGRVQVKIISHHFTTKSLWPN